MEINGYPNYLIYEDGRVYNKKFKRFLTANKDTNGYYYNQLYNNNKCQNISVHRLIALHYIPNPNNYPEVDHIDRNRQNNNISNLRWVSKSMQNENRVLPPSNTGEKYICKRFINKNYYYSIVKKNCFRESLPCNDNTLDDAINLRDLLLSINN